MNNNINFLGLILLVPFFGYSLSIMILSGYLAQITNDDGLFKLFIFLLSYQIFGFFNTLVHVFLILVYKLGENRQVLITSNWGFISNKLNLLYSSSYYKLVADKYTLFVELDIVKKINGYLNTVYGNAYLLVVSVFMSNPLISRLFNKFT